MTFHAVCLLEDIPSGRARGFCENEGGERTVFIVRRDDTVFAYRNSCPHSFRPLEYRRDEFLSADGSQIMCFTHGARFEIASGLCVAGPCMGQSLTRVETRVRNGTVEIKEGSPSNEECRMTAKHD